LIPVFILETVAFDARFSDAGRGVCIWVTACTPDSVRRMGGGNLNATQPMLVPDFVPAGTVKGAGRPCAITAKM
ncbi:MAG: hypothetical protein ACYCZX_17150, partial [Rhodospirillaceae bacterium]